MPAVNDQQYGSGKTAPVKIEVGLVYVDVLRCPAKTREVVLRCLKTAYLKDETVMDAAWECQVVEGVGANFGSRALRTFREFGLTDRARVEAALSSGQLSPKVKKGGWLCRNYGRKTHAAVLNWLKVEPGISSGKAEVQ